MEGSIKRAEKLIHATNSALAQMKQNLTFDNVKEPPVNLGLSKPKIDRNKKTFSYERDLDEFEREFRADANEMLMKMDKILEPNNFVSSRYSSVQASKTREKMKEINQILASRRSDFSQSKETERSRQKIFNLINGEIATPSSARVSSRKSYDAIKKTLSRGNLQAKMDATKKNKTISQKHKVDVPKVVVDKSKEELKIKLLETQDIVNRGFQTARQLSHKVEHMTKVEAKKSEKTPSSVKTVVSDVVSVNGLNRSKKSESNETIKTICPSEKCSKRQELRKINKKEETKTVELKRDDENEKEAVNVEKLGISERERNPLVKIIRKETKKVKDVSKLRLEHLPSVHIRGSLQMQRVHSLFLPADNQQKSVPKTNTSIKILSHEGIELGKKNNFVENFQRVNCLCEGEDEEKTDYIECFNCGKLIKMHKTKINSKEIDNLLLKCDFNVFDPRIDEFVEKCKGTMKTSETRRRTTDEPYKMEEIEMGEIIKNEKEKKPETVRLVKDKKNLKIQELSQRLTQKYREEIDYLEDYEENFEKILKSLFKKIDDSRKFFDFKSSPAEKQPEIERKKLNLTMSKPFLVCLKSDFEEFEEKKDLELKNKEEKGTETDEILGGKILRRRQRRKKLDKKDVKNKFDKKVVESSVNHIGFGFAKENLGKRRNIKSQSLRLIQSLINNTAETSSNIFSAEMETPIQCNKAKDIKNNEAKLDLNIDGEGDKMIVQPTNLEKMEEVELKSLGNMIDNRTCEEPVYESDFEGESPTFINCNGNKDEEEENLKEVRITRNLSTISEIDSESEKWTEKSSSVDEKMKKSAKISGEVFTKTFEKNFANTILKHRSDVVEAGQIKTSEMIRSPSTSIIEKPRDAVANEMLHATSPKSLSDHQISSKSKSDSTKSQKSSSTEVIVSLKEVLSALKNQFERTQTLANKLTDSVKTLKAESAGPEPDTVCSWNSDSVPVTTPDVVKQRNLESGAPLLKPNKKKSRFTILQPPLDSAKSKYTKTGGKHSPDNEFSIEELCLNDSRTEPVNIALDNVWPDENVRGGSLSTKKSPTGSPSSEKMSSAKLKNEKRLSDVLPVQNNSIEDEIVSSIVLNEEIEGGAGGSSLQSIGELISESISGMSRTPDHSWPSH